VAESTRWELEISRIVQRGQGPWQKTVRQLEEAYDNELLQREGGRDLRDWLRWCGPFRVFVSCFRTARARKPIIRKTGAKSPRSAEKVHNLRERATEEETAKALR